MKTINETYHPNAFLQRVKNVRTGLTSRTKILNFLDKQAANAGAVGNAVSMSYSAVIHHLRLMEAEGTIRRIGKRPCSWVVTGTGQRRLVA